MASTVDISWYPQTPQAGDQIAFTATLTTAIAGLQVQISISAPGISGVEVGQAYTDADGKAFVLSSAPAAGTYQVVASYVDVDGLSRDSDPATLVVQAPSVTSPPASSTPGPASPSLPGALPVPNAMTGGVSATVQAIYNAFVGESDVDPYTGAPVADPFTAEPVSSRSSMPFVPESTRDAILNFYNQRAVDFTGVPQSVQNSILDIFAQPPANTPLPGIGLDEFITQTISSNIGGPVSAFSSEAGAISSVINSLSGVPALELTSTGHALDQILKPVFAAGQMVGGFGEADKGIGLMLGGGVPGFVIGGAMVFHGSDQFITGSRVLLGDEDAQSLTREILTAIGKPVLGADASSYASALDALAPFGLSGLAESFGGLGETGLRSLSTEAVPARSELSEATQLSGDAKSIAAPAEASSSSAVGYAELPRPEIATISSDWSEGTQMERTVAALREGNAVEKSMVAVEFIGQTPQFEEARWAVYENFATKNNLQEFYKITENGRRYDFLADGLSADGRYFLEAKEGEMGLYKNRRDLGAWEEGIYQQARRYLIVIDAMNKDGVRYLLSDPRKVEGFTNLLKGWFPEEISSGKITVEWVPMP